jgi:hypothetical protein
MAVQQEAKSEALKNSKSYQFAVKDPMGFLQYQQSLFDNPYKKDELFPKGMSDEVGIFDRIRADIKGDVSKVGEENFLKKIFGDTNVIKRNDGNFFIREGKGYGYVELNPEGFQMKDVAEISGEALVIAPTLFTSNPWLAGLYAIGGGTALQGVAETIPGETEIEAGDRLKKIAAEGVFGAGGQWAANGLIDFFSKVGIKNFITKKAIKALDERGAKGAKYYERGLELEEKVGPLSFGEISGEPTLRAIEDFLRSYWLTRGSAQPIGTAQLNAARDAMHNFMKVTHNYSNDPMAARSGERIGGELVKSFKGVLDSFIDIRRKKADDLYNNIKFVTDSTGKQVDVSGMPTIRINEVDAQLDDMIKEASKNQDDRLLGDLRGWKEKITEKVTIKEDGSMLIPYESFNTFLKLFSKASYGKGTVFKNLDTAGQRYPAKEIFTSFNNALDDTIKAYDGGLTTSADDAINSQVAKNLQRARDTYKKDTAAIEELENSFLADFIAPGAKKSKTAVLEKFQKLKPEEIEQAFDLLKTTNNGNVVESIKKSFISDVFEDARATVLDLDLDKMDVVQQGNVIKKIFEPNKFLQKLDEKVGEDRLKVLFNPKELAELTDILEYIQRVNFNNVKPKTGIFDIILSFVQPTAAAVRLIGLNRATELFFSPKGRKSLKAAFEALQSDKPLNELPKNIAGSLLDFYLLAETVPTDYLQKFLDQINVPQFSFENIADPSVSEKIKMSAQERFSPEYQEQQEKALQDLQSFNIPSPQVSRGQGVDVIPPLSAPINPQTVASLESIGMPLFNAAEGGIVDLYESKKFKKPQVVA